MKKILFLSILFAALNVSVFSQTSKETISGAMVNVLDNFETILPENSAILGNQPDAFIGKFFPSIPMHWTAGLSISATVVESDFVDEAVSDLQSGISSALKAGNATEGINIDYSLPKYLPVPTCAFTFRLGGIALPFDLGIYGMTTFKGILNDISYQDFTTSMDYMTLGADLRFAVYQGNALLPKISIGGGYMMSKLSFEFGMDKDFMTNKTFDIGGIKKSYTANVTSDIDLSIVTHTLFGEVQASKKILIFEPYIGVKALFTRSDCEYDWKYDTKVNNTYISALSDADNRSYTDNFDSDITTQVFTGCGFQLGFLQLAVNASYNFVSNKFSGSLGFNFKH